MADERESKQSVLSACLDDDDDDDSVSYYRNFTLKQSKISVGKYFLSNRTFTLNIFY